MAATESIEEVCMFMKEWGTERKRRREGENRGGSGNFWSDKNKAGETTNGGLGMEKKRAEFVSNVQVK